MTAAEAIRDIANPLDKVRSGVEVIVVVEVDKSAQSCGRYTRN